MDSYDLVRVLGIGMALVLAIVGLKGRGIGLSDGVRMAALWAFLIIALALIFSRLG